MEKTLGRWFFHIDLNAFFVSVEEIKNPALKDKPVCVAGRSLRAVISTANYIARSYGIRAAMPVYKAKAILPSLICLEGDYEMYSEYSRRFVAILTNRFSKYVEVSSIDECYVDVSHKVNSVDSALKYANEIQSTIKKLLGIGCSIGISDRKYLAKICSDFKKPMGISVLMSSQVVEVLHPMPIQTLLGVGESSRKFFNDHKIFTVGEFLDASQDTTLRRNLGKNFHSLHLQASGQLVGSVEVYRDTQKSVSSSYTFEKDSDQESVIIEYLYRAVKQVANELRRMNLVSKHFSLLIKNSHPNIQMRIQRSRSVTLDKPTCDETTLRFWAANLLEEYLQLNCDKYILVGFAAHNLINSLDLNQQLAFDDYETPQSKTEILAKKINRKFKKVVIKKFE